MRSTIALGSAGFAAIAALFVFSCAASDSSAPTSNDAGASTAGSGGSSGASAGATSSGGAAGSGSGGDGAGGAGTGGANAGGSSGADGVGGASGTLGGNGVAGGAGDSGNAGSGGQGGTAGSSPDAGSGGGAIDGGPSATEGGTGAPGKIAGTVSIFDGTTLNGWVQSAKNWWSVKDGVIDGKSPTGGAVLMTADDYGDFRLIVSSRMVFNANTGHLGVCFWGGRTPIGSYNKCKLYIPPNRYTWDYNTNGGLNKVTNAPGANGNNGTMWHQTEILCRIAKGHCQVATDGKLMLTYDEVAISTVKKGPIGLQIHAGDSEVQYKDVYIDAAPVDDKMLTLTP